MPDASTQLTAIAALPGLATMPDSTTLTFECETHGRSGMAVVSCLAFLRADMRQYLEVLQ
jgi:hypothetical protein